MWGAVSLFVGFVRKGELYTIRARSSDINKLSSYKFILHILWHFDNRMLSAI